MITRGLTLRETIEFNRNRYSSPFVGSARTVPDEIERWFEARAFDGINVHAGHPSQFRRFTAEVPLLQARGLFRSDYEHSTLRGNLGLSIPTNIRVEPLEDLGRIDIHDSQMA